MSRTVLLATSLDPVTHAKVMALATAVQWHRPRLLRYVLPWGRAHGANWPISRDRPPSPSQNLSVRVTEDLRQQVYDTAAASGVPVSTWLRHVMQHITPDDFRTNGPPEITSEDEEEDRTRRGLRSHESQRYARRFMIRVDEATGRKLALFMQTFERPAAEIIRHLIAQATLEDFPRGWLLAAQERRLPCRSQRERREQPHGFGSCGRNGRPPMSTGGWYAPSVV
jgi:predicted HicB family RNase H-like nuclease